MIAAAASNSAGNWSSVKYLAEFDRINAQRLPQVRNVSCGCLRRVAIPAILAARIGMEFRTSATEDVLPTWVRAGHRTTTRDIFPTWIGAQRSGPAAATDNSARLGH